MERMAYSTGTTALAFLLAPESVERFLGEVLGQRLLYVPGTCEKAASLFSWHELNRIISEHRLTPSRMRLALEGRPQAALPFLRPSRPSGLVQRGLDANPLDLEALYVHLRGKATLILDAVDEACPPLARLCHGLTRCFLMHSQVNAYANIRNVHGLGLHWDDYGVLVVQTAGSKAWWVFRPSFEAPLVHDAVSERPPRKAQSGKAS
jgi:bifunctional lysine-specific demethylase and histidyl-hydroxylase MINA